MGKSGTTAGLFVLALAFAATSCNSLHTASDEPRNATSRSESISVYARYAPVKIHIMPLTKFVPLTENVPHSKIHLYVTLLDSFGSQIKAPAVFRFELYERVRLSSRPKGRRIVLWPDIDLTAPIANDRCWSDFLIAYEFNLSFEPKTNKSYIIQVTAMCPDGKRLSAEITIKSSI